MSLEDKCSHDVIYYGKYLDYNCSRCGDNMKSNYFGGKLDLSEYSTNVVGYQSLRLERTRPKEQLELFK